MERNSINGRMESGQGRFNRTSGSHIETQYSSPVSFNVLREFEAYLGKEPNEAVEYRLVKVIESRPVSNQIAADLGVKHESPQIICIKNSENYWNASHYAITDEHMTAVLN